MNCYIKRRIADPDIFYKKIRQYNSMFAFTSMGGTQLGQWDFHKKGATQLGQ